MIRHFDLLYIQQGLSRLTTSQRLNLFPTVIRGLGTNYQQSVQHAAILFNLILKLLHTIDLPPRGSDKDSALREEVGLHHDPEDAAFLAQWFGKFLLYTISKPDGKRCFGLTEDDCKFLELFGKSDTWNSSSLTETKVLVVKFVASGAFHDSERFFPALYASADPNSRIHETANDMLKRAAAAVSLEDTEIVRKIFNLYLGGEGSHGPLPARTTLQIKLLGYLCRSKVAADFTKECLEVVQQGLASNQQPDTLNGASKKQKGLEASKFRGQVFAFTNWLARISPAPAMKKFAPAMIGYIRNYVDDQGWPRPRTEQTLDAAELNSRSYGYESIGLLAAACAEQLLLEPNIELLRWLMTSLSEDSSGQEVSLSIEHALSSTIRAFGGGLKTDVEQSLASLFLHHMDLSPDSHDDERYV